MKHLTLVLLVLLLVGCTLPAPVTEPPNLTITPTETGEATDTPQATDTPEPTATLTAEPTETVVPTATEFPTPTRIVEVTPTNEPVVDPENRLINGTFEGEFQLVGTITGGGFIADGWHITACNYPWTPEACDIPPPYCSEAVTTSCNDPGKMATCEWKIAPVEFGDPFRVHSGDYAQQWFIPGKIAHCGIYQEIATQPGETCTIKAWVQTWGSHEGPSNVSGNPARSDYKTDDDRANMTFWLGAWIDGPEPAFPYGDGIDRSRDFGYDDGIYDEAAQGDPQGGAFIEWSFVANRDKTSIFIMAENKFPVGNANWYVDDASVVCGFTEELGQGGGGEVVTETLMDDMESVNMDGLLSFVEVLLGLVPVVGFAAPLIAFVVDQLKRFRLLGDGWAPLASLVLNLVIFGVVFFVGDDGLADVENIVAILTDLAPYIVGLLGALLATPAVHDALERVGIGFKHKAFPGAAG